MRKDVLAGVGVGAALLGGAAFYYFRERSQDEPGFRPLETDGRLLMSDLPPRSSRWSSAAGRSGVIS